jgi:hypothetical protein
MLTAKITDVSHSLFISFCRELGDIIMGGMTATEFKDFKEAHRDSPEAIKELVRDLTFKVSFIRFL